MYQGGEAVSTTQPQGQITWMMSWETEDNGGWSFHNSLAEALAAVPKNDDIISVEIEKFLESLH